MNGEEQTVVKSTAQIDWRRLLLLFLLIMVLPTITAFSLDLWLDVLPIFTVVAIVICFPAATFLVMRTAIQEMDRVIAEVAPPPLPESDSTAELDSGFDNGHEPEVGVEASSTPNAEVI